MKGALTPEQLSEALGVPLKTLANWRWRRSGPAFIKIGQRVRYPRAALADWMKQNTRTPNRPSDLRYPLSLPTAAAAGANDQA